AVAGRNTVPGFRLCTGSNPGAAGAPAVRPVRTAPASRFQGNVLGGRGVGICFTELFAAPDARRGRVLVRRTGNPWRESAEVRPILYSNVFSGRAVRRVLSAWLPAIHAHPGDGLLGGGSFHVRAFWRDLPGQHRRELDWHPRCRQHRILLLPDGAPHRESLVRGGLP